MNQLKISTQRLLENSVEELRALLKQRRQLPTENLEVVLGEEVIVARRIPFADACAVTECARVFSIDHTELIDGRLRVIKTRERISSQSIDSYKCAGVLVGGKWKTMKIHQLVGSAFLGWIPHDPLGLVIDHIDGIKNNNHVVNLRLVPNSINRHNVENCCAGKSGVRGVKWNRGAWEVVFQVGGRIMRLGRTRILEDAIQIRKMIKEEFWLLWNQPDGSTKFKWIEK